MSLSAYLHSQAHTYTSTHTHAHEISRSSSKVNYVEKILGNRLYIFCRIKASHLILSVKDLTLYPNVLIYLVANCNFFRIFPGVSDGKESACNVGHPGSIPGLGRSLGEGNGNPL